MKFNLLRGLLISMTLAGLAVVPTSAIATTTTQKADAARNSTPTTTDSTADQAKLTFIIQQGNTEINRRLATLDTLTAKISAATKLSVDDKTTLTTEVSNEISGLTGLMTKLDADSDATSAKADAQSIFNDYRVYALIVPKVDLVKTADDQQVVETNLAALVPKVQTRITADQQAKKDVAALQASLNDIQAKLAAAQAVSTTIETKVIGLQPSDYNSDHTILSGDRDQLTAAQANLKAASTDAQTIVTDLKNLK